MFLRKKVVLLLIICFMALIVFACQRAPVEKYSLSAQELDLLQPGDIILRMGTGSLSKAINSYLDEDLELSHIGILSNKESGRWMVIHSVSKHLSETDGLQQQDLAAFVEESVPRSIIITRLRKSALPEGLGLLMEQKALHYLAEKVPFDYSFSLEDQSRLYCSELIWQIIRESVGMNVFEEKNTSHITMGFSAFLNPKYFEIIISHPGVLH